MRALLVGLFALFLVSQAAAAAMQGGTAPAPTKAKVEQRALTLDQRLERKLAALQKYRGTVRSSQPPLAARLGRDRRRTPSPRSPTRRTRVRQLTETVRALRAEVRPARRARLEALPPRSGHLQRLRISLRRGDLDRVVRVPTEHRRPRTASTSASSRWGRTSGACSVTAEGARAGKGRASLLRPLRPRLEPVELPLGGV